MISWKSMDRVRAVALLLPSWSSFPLCSWIVCLSWDMGYASPVPFNIFITNDTTMLLLMMLQALQIYLYQNSKANTLRLALFQQCKKTPSCGATCYTYQEASWHYTSVCTMFCPGLGNGDPHITYLPTNYNRLLLSRTQILNRKYQSAILIVLLHIALSDR